MMIKNQTKRMTEMFPKSIRYGFPVLYQKEGTPLRDQVARVKFFAPRSNWIWYGVECRFQDDDVLFFGYVIGHEQEAGYFYLSELAGSDVERDETFVPTRLGTLCPDLEQK